MTRKTISPEATAALHDVMRKACERMERRSKSDRALELFEKGRDTPTICALLNVDIHSIWSMLRCARIKRERRHAEEAGRIADEMGANI
jgi:hypothetical protein